MIGLYHKEFNGRNVAFKHYFLVQIKGIYDELYLIIGFSRLKVIHKYQHH
jgi:hypothetical protein